MNSRTALSSWLKKTESQPTTTTATALSLTGTVGAWLPLITSLFWLELSVIEWTTVIALFEGAKQVAGWVLLIKRLWVKTTEVTQ